MPSPLGHALGGIAAAWAIDLIPGRREWRMAPSTAPFYNRAGGPLTLVCAGLAALPDVDLAFGGHRTATHSIAAALLVTIVAAAVTGWVTRGTATSGSGGVARVALMCGVAYATHPLLDWLAVDRYVPAGIQLWWPFSDKWFISDLNIFPPTQRYPFFLWASIRTNVAAMAWETALLLPLVALMWSIRVKALARFATKVSRGDHAA